VTVTRVLMSAALAVALIAVPACSDDDATSDATPRASGTPAPASTPSSGGPGEVTVPRINDEQGLTTVEIVNMLAPSVVRIQTETASIDIFGRLIPGQGVGTGVIIDNEGRIVTNNHVIIGANGLPAETITVTLHDQRTAPARVVGRDEATDLAVIQIDVDGLTPAQFGIADELQVGQDVVAIGFALDLEGAPTVTRGVLSAKNRTIDEDPYTIPDAIQTDASINPGNSGGALVNARGEVIGINTAIIRGAQNIGFAISVGLVKPIVDELITAGEVRRAYMGVGTVDINPAIARNFNLPVETGLAITAVGPGSPAALAGLRVNDVIVAVDGREIDNNGQLLAILAEKRAGENVTVTYYRAGERLEAQLTLATRPE